MMFCVIFLSLLGYAKDEDSTIWSGTSGFESHDYRAIEWAPKLQISVQGPLRVPFDVHMGLLCKANPSWFASQRAAALVDPSCAETSLSLTLPSKS